MSTPPRQRRDRRGFNLLEVMVSLGILVVSLVILMETQNSSVHATREAERIITATHLAQEKLSEVMLLVEEEGFGDEDIEESGDFSEWGDEGLDLQFAELGDYEWEYTVLEIDIGLAGDLTGMADTMAGSGVWGEPSSEVQASTSTESGQGMGMDLSAFGISNEMITEMLGHYIREVRVVVWWGGSYDVAEERGDMVTVTTHVINPSGSVLGVQGGSSTSSGASPMTNQGGSSSSSMPGGARVRPN